MQRIFVFTQGQESEAVIERLVAWTASDLLHDLYVATAPEGAAGKQDVAVRRVSKSSVQTLTLEELLDSLNDVPMLINVCLSRDGGATLTGKSASEILYQSILEVADAESVIPKAVVFATDTPNTRFDSSNFVSWSDRFFLVPEDRVRPTTTMAHLDSESVPGHIAAGLASLCGLWRGSESGATLNNGIVDQVMQRGTPGQFEMMYLYRNFVRIVEFPTMVPEILEMTSREFKSNELPNPDQSHYERTSLQTQLPVIAQAFIADHLTLQAGEPRLVPPDPEPAKLGLIPAIQMVVRQALQQLVLKPAQIIDDVLGHYYDEVAQRVERLAPGGSISIARWRELGQPGAAESSIAEEVSKDLDRLAEPDMTQTWTTFRELCLGLLDGDDNGGIKPIKSKLFQSSQDRQMISPFPHEIVGDPFEVKSSAESLDSAVGEVSNATDAGVPLTQPAEPQKSEVEVVPLTRLIRGRIESELNTSRDFVTKLRSDRSETEAKSEKDPIQDVVETQKKLQNKIASTVRTTFLGIVATVLMCVGGVTSLIHPHYHGFLPRLIVSLLITGPVLLASVLLRSPMISVVTLGEIALLSDLTVSMNTAWRWHFLILGLLTLLQSPLLLALSIWKSAQRQKELDHEIKETIRGTINQVLAEAHHISATTKLERRLREFDDWEYIIGLVAHHPFVFESQQAPSSSISNLGFPSAVALGTARVSRDDLVKISSDFRRELFAPGWLNTRYLQLRESLVDDVHVALGVATDNTLIQIEGDTSSDLQSPRKVYRSLLQSAIEGQDSSPIVNQLNLQLSKTSLVNLVDSIEFQPVNGTLEQLGSDEFLREDLDVSGSLLQSHWEAGAVKETASIRDNFKFGDSDRLTLEGKQDVAPKLIVGCLQLTERLNPDNLVAFHEQKAE